MGDLGSCHTIQVTSQPLDRSGLPNPDIFKRGDWLYNHEAVLVGHQLYVFGGHNIRGGHRRGMFVLDTVSWRWSTWSTDCDMSIGEFTMVLVDSKLYFFGGYSPEYEGDRRKLLCIDLPLQELVSVETSGESLIPHGTASGNYIDMLGIIVVFGGARFYERTNSLIGYYPDSRSWKPLFARGQSPQPRRASTSWLLGRSDIVYYGGISNTTLSSDIFILRYQSNHFTWSTPKFSMAPEARFRARMCCVGDRAFIFGGYMNSRLAECNDLFICDLKDHTAVKFGHQSKTTGNGILSIQVDGMQSLSRTAAHSIVVTKTSIIILGGTEVSPAVATVLKAKKL